MAFNKAKAIEAAQKLVAQGKMKDAANAYLKIHQQEPKDQNVLNTLGDLYVRLNNLAQGLTYYTKLADMYVSDGFLVRGIAMYKKISKLEPGNSMAMERLADLYTMQGLMKEARSHYLQLAEAHVKANQPQKAMGVMQKVLDLDPDNLKIQQRLADLYQGHGQGAEAAQIYRRVAEHELDADRIEEALKWLQKATALAPENAEGLLLQAQLQQRQGKAAEALATLEKIPNLEQHPEALSLLISARLEGGEAKAAEELAEKLFAADSKNFGGLLQVAQHAAKQKEGERALSWLQRVAEPALEHDPFRLLEAVRSVSSLLGESVEAADLFVETAQKAGETEVQIEALNRRAEMAVRAEDFTRAKQLYDRMVSLQPENPDFAQKLKAMREKLGEPVVVAEAPGAPHSFAELAEAAPTEALDEETQAYVNASMTDIDLFSSYGMTDKAIELARQVIERVPNHVLALEKLLDFYLGSGNDQGVVETARRLEPLYRQAGKAERADEVAETAGRYGAKIQQEAPAAEPAAEAAAAAPEAALHEVDLSAEWASATGLEEAAEAPAEAAPAEAEAAAPAFNAKEAGEEIDFYLSQGLAEQARAALEGYEQRFPGEPALAELRARVEAAPIEAPPAEAPAEPLPVEPVPAEAASEESKTHEVILEAQPQEQPAPAGTGMSADEFFSDLAGDLDQALEGAVPPAERQAAPSPPPAPAPAAKEEEKEAAPVGVLAEVFEEFKEELGEVEEVEDLETHYNLGIAYKEMGLMEEAISEFQKVVKASEKERSASHLFQVCTLLGMCFVEKGMPQIAVRWYERALKSPGVDEEGSLALRYDMGMAHEQAGNKKAALNCFMEVYGANVDYRNVGERIRELEGA
ncbi:tetratricopeptide repeat protein [Acidobacteriia bacterium AH_259_A11_L15]|nr:tetratricopeptide repeat protein [Acidobacteriia bacterium AH_259_A11_L15]